MTGRKREEGFRESSPKKDHRLTVLELSVPGSTEAKLISVVSTGRFGVQCPIDGGGFGGACSMLTLEQESSRCGLRLEVQSTKVPAYNCGGLCQDLVNNCQHWREPARKRWGNPDNGRVQAMCAMQVGFTILHPLIGKLC